MKRIIVTGHNFASLITVARCLGGAGYEADVLRVGKKTGNFIKDYGRFPEAKSKYVTRHVVCGVKDPEVYAKKLVSEFAGEDKALVIPVDDGTAEIIDSHFDILKEHFILPEVEGRQGAVIALMDKHYQKGLAKKANLPVPEGWSVEIKNKTYALPEGIAYPCFVKPELPFKGRKAFMGKCDTPEELKKILDSAADTLDCLMLVEEYVEIEKEYGVVGLAYGEVCVPGIIEKTSVGHGSQAGVTVCGKIHAPSEYPELTEKLKAFMKLTGFTGMFDIDLYESRGEMYFNELNVRMGGEGAGLLASGVNLPGMYADAVNGKEIDFNAAAPGITFVNERPLASEYEEGFITKKEFKRIIKSADAGCIYSEDDPAPYKEFGRLVRKGAFKRALSK